MSLPPVSLTAVESPHVLDRDLQLTIDTHSKSYEDYQLTLGYFLKQETCITTSMNHFNLNITWDVSCWENSGNMYSVDQTKQYAGSKQQRDSYAICEWCCIFVNNGMTDGHKYLVLMYMVIMLGCLIKISRHVNDFIDPQLGNPVVTTAPLDIQKGAKKHTRWRT